MHSIRKERMIVCIVRIILTCIIFRNNAIRSKIKHQTEIFSIYIFTKDIRKLVFLNNLSDHQPGSDSEAAASHSSVNSFRDIFIREILEIVFIRLHPGRILLGFLTYGCSLRICFLRCLIIDPVVFVINIVHITLFSIGDFTIRFRYFYQKIQIHNASIYRCIYAY